ncbi:MAG: hypothetical protein ACO3LE_08270 [Bdellovibrionota bacterium]
MSAPSQINISIKMLNGDLIPLGIPSDITVKQFYRMVWQLIPTQIPLQSLDLFRSDSEQPLPHTPMALLPEEDEIFCAFIQPSHFTLRLELVADAFDQENHYQAFEVVIHESHSEAEESKSNPPSIVNFNLPHTQDGNLVKASYRYDTYRITFFAQTHLDSKGKVSRESTHTFYSEENIQILRRGRYGDEWEIHIPEDKQSLYQLMDVLHSLPLSERTLRKLSEALQSEWDEFFTISLGSQIEEIPLDPAVLQAAFDDGVLAAFELDQIDQGDDEILGEWA